MEFLKVQRMLEPAIFALSPNSLLSATSTFSQLRLKKTTEKFENSCMQQVVASMLTTVVFRGLKRMKKFC